MQKRATRIAFRATTTEKRLLAELATRQFQSKSEVLRGLLRKEAAARGLRISRGASAMVEMIRNAHLSDAEVARRLRTVYDLILSFTNEATNRESLDSETRSVADAMPASKLDATEG